MCKQPSDTARYCPDCGEFIGDCCRYKPAARGWAATKKAMRHVRALFTTAMARKAT